MILELKKPITKAKIERMTQKLTTVKSAKKKFTAAKYTGKIKWEDNAIDIQKAMRDEWQ